MGSGVMTVQAKFHEDWFSHSKVDGGGGNTDAQHGDRMSLLSFFQNKKSKLHNEIPF
jgi:hypothetical protein